MIYGNVSMLASYLKNKMPSIFRIIICLLLITNSVIGQNLSVNTIELNYGQLLDDESISNLYFSKDGKYFFLKETDEFGLFITTDDTLTAPPRKGGSYSIFGRDGEVESYYISRDTFYYKNPKSIKYYTNGYGKIVKHISDFSHDNIAITTEKGNSLYYFINGKLVASTEKNEASGVPDFEKWCDFGGQDNILYYVLNNGIWYLYRNEELIDTTRHRFIGLSINSNGDYIYGKGKKGIDGTYFDYMFFPNYNGHWFDSVRTIWDSWINDFGGYYLSGDGYIIVNGKRYNYPVPEGLILPDSINYFFFDDVPSNLEYHTANGSKEIGRGRIYSPSVDNEGNFAFIRKKWFSRSVISKADPKRKTKGKPISVDPYGNYISYSKRGNSVKIFRNDSLLFVKKGKVEIFNQMTFFDRFGYYKQNDPRRFNIPFQYIEVGDKGYVLWGSSISEPIERISIAETTNVVTGELVTGYVNEYGFYLILNYGKGNFNLIVNNQVIDLNESISEIFVDSVFFDQDGLVFYGVVGKKVKRFAVHF